MLIHEPFFFFLNGNTFSVKAGKALLFHHIHTYCIGMFRVLPFLSANHDLYPKSGKTSYVHNVCFLLITES